VKKQAKEELKQLTKQELAKKIAEVRRQIVEARLKGQLLRKLRQEIAIMETYEKA